MYKQMFMYHITRILEEPDVEFFGGPVPEQLRQLVLEYHTLGLNKETMVEAIQYMELSYDEAGQAVTTLGELAMFINYHESL
jgi:hypothetical protein